MRMLVALVLGAVACASTPVPGPHAPTDPTLTLPTADAKLKRWEAIRADGFKPPAGTTAATLVSELELYLGSPDPARRDAVAFDALQAWIVVDKRLAPAELKPLARRLADNLRGGPRHPDAPERVYLRSFSALALSLIVKRDLAEPFLDDDERHMLLAAAADYAARETDLRGYTGERGWSHAAAHTADLLRVLAREPAFTPADRGLILDAVANLVVRRHGAILHHGEDGRLAQPVIEAVRRGVIADKLPMWLQTIAAPLLERATATYDAGLYAAQRNARNLLFTLFVQLSLDTDPGEGGRALLAQITKLLGE